MMTWEIACPRCDAQPNEACLNPDRTPFRADGPLACHAERQEAALAHTDAPGSAATPAEFDDAVDASGLV